MKHGYELSAISFQLAIWYLLIAEADCYCPALKINLGAQASLPAIQKHFHLTLRANDRESGDFC
jgi:hypothetical protein